MNKIINEFIKFCCNYAKDYILKKIGGNGFVINIDNSQHELLIEDIVKNVNGKYNIFIRDLIQRARQGINNTDRFAINIIDEYIDKRKNNISVYDDKTGDVVKMFYYKKYNQFDNFTVEELALIDAIDYIRLDMDRV